MKIKELRGKRGSQNFGCLIRWVAVFQLGFLGWVWEAVAVSNFPLYLCLEFSKKHGKKPKLPGKQS